MHEAARRGDSDRAVRLLGVMRTYELMAEQDAKAEGLRGPPQTRTVHSEVLSAEHRANLSVSQGAHGKKFLKWIRDPANGRWTMNSLAKAVPMSPSAISQAQRRKGDELSRPIRKGRAERIETLTKWPADEAHWPGGILED